MLEQWEADHLLGVPKIYSHSTVVDLSRGTSHDYQVEDADGTEFFLLDVWRPSRSRHVVRVQLRYRRSIELARLCTGRGHTNPDGELLSAPHMHRYREGYEVKWAVQLEPFPDVAEALLFFCREVNLALPDIQGGLP
jgi:hypothetical protein